MSIGIFIALFSLLMIRKEVMKASFFKNVKVSDPNANLLIDQMQALENKVDEMNQSFYDIVNDLEGKYSVHEKELEILEGKLNEISDINRQFSKMLNYQGKEIASIKEEPSKEKLIKNKEVIRPKAVEKKEVQPIETNVQEDVKEEIIRLKSLGYDDQAIARQLGKGIREIKMLMKLIK